MTKTITYLIHAPFTCDAADTLRRKPKGAAITYPFLEQGEKPRTGSADS